MIISSANDYREAARRRLPPFLFHYIDGGAYAEYTLKRNVEDLSKIALRQRVLNDMSQLSLETKLFDETLSMPVALSPVGLTGMYARRGEVQAAVAADKKGIPFTLSTVSVCPIEERMMSNWPVFTEILYRNTAPIMIHAIGHKP